LIYCSRSISSSFLSFNLPHTTPPLHCAVSVRPRPVPAHTKRRCFSFGTESWCCHSDSDIRPSTYAIPSDSSFWKSHSNIISSVSALAFGGWYNNIRQRVVSQVVRQPPFDYPLTWKPRSIISFSSSFSSSAFSSSSSLLLVTLTRTTTTQGSTRSFKTLIPRESVPSPIITTKSKTNMKDTNTATATTTNQNNQNSQSNTSNNNNNKVKVLFLGGLHHRDAVTQCIVKIQQLHATPTTGPFHILLGTCTDRAALQYLQSVYQQTHDPLHRHHDAAAHSRQAVSMPLILPPLYLQDTLVTA
jgi:hypothetical protein